MYWFGIVLVAGLLFQADCTKREVRSVCDCERTASPVCGTDGVTYNNPCLLDCARESNNSLKLDYPGTCEHDLNNPNVLHLIEPTNPSCKCPIELNLVCGSNGRTYSSPCYLECVGIKQAKEGMC